jgi:hypothetical protein
MEWLINRIREPSTWAGVAQVAATAAIPGAPLWFQILNGICGTVAILAREKPSF